MNNSHKATRRAAGLAGTSAALVAAAALLAQGSANADVFVKLPNQVQNTTLQDGTKVSITRTGETATIAPSLGGTPLHRAAQVSARYQVTSSKKAKIRIQAGYIVGCQVSIASTTSGGSGTTTENLAGTSTATGGGANQSLTLGPGQATQYFINQVEKADDFGSQQYTNNVDYEGSKLKLSYTGSQLQLTGCAGYAQARSVAIVRVRTSNVDKQVTFYGKPFSIG
ncbi:MspA family porin [Williamsia sp.]|uniref:MspA family porin n=1 Tax=Williamsia sp. TaxID=1872085 RepID=UPI001A2DAFFB|nr:MspA family porin [Williamsia sp.]MBJ7287349.1 MspA family porin [Williamsia sp.]